MFDLFWPWWFTSDFEVTTEFIDMSSSVVVASGTWANAYMDIFYVGLIIAGYQIARWIQKC